MKIERLIATLAGATLLLSCGTPREIIKYVDREVEKVRFDTLTVEKTKIERVRDFTGLLDTLHLETASAEAVSWIDTTQAVLRGSLSDKPNPVTVVVPVKEKEKIVVRDSLVFRDRIIKEKEPIYVKTVPLFWRVMGVLGIITTVILLTWLFFKIRKKIN